MTSENLPLNDIKMNSKGMYNLQASKIKTEGGDGRKGSLMPYLLLAKGHDARDNGDRADRARDVA